MECIKSTMNHVTGCMDHTFNLNNIAQLPKQPLMFVANVIINYAVLAYSVSTSDTPRSWEAAALVTSNVVTVLAIKYLSDNNYR